HAGDGVLGAGAFAAVGPLRRIAAAGGSDVGGATRLRAAESLRRAEIIVLPDVVVAADEIDVLQHRVLAADPQRLQDLGVGVGVALDAAAPAGIEAAVEIAEERAGRQVARVGDAGDLVAAVERELPPLVLADDLAGLDVLHSRLQRRRRRRHRSRAPG